jgi:hypothetical protein
MNASFPAVESVPLLDIVDLKWLLAREGIRLHVERLQLDAGYADALLEHAERSDNEALREAARRVRQRLGGCPAAI